MSPLQLLGLALALSLAGNAWQIHTYLGVRDERTEAIGARDQARGAATMCSDATEALQEQAKQAKADNALAVARAAASAAARERAAMAQLAKPATRPGDDCGSARDRIDDWIKGRARP